MLFEDEEKIVPETEEVEDEEENVEGEKELESGIMAGLTNVDTVGLVQESFLDNAHRVI